MSDLSEVKAIAAGSSHSLALKEDGAIWAWGDNKASQGTRIGGQLGDDTISASNTPVEVGDLGRVNAISAGGSHNLALKEDGTVWAWGYNEQGQLGDGTNATSSTPVEVSGLSGVKAISGGGAYSLALKDDGTVWAWGSNQFGQLGNGISASANETMCEDTGQTGMPRSSCTDNNTPIQVSELDEIKAISAGGSHGLALQEDGTVWAWGSNGSGQLGYGPRTVSPTLGINTPAQVSELSGVKAIAAGSSHNLAGW